MEGSNTEQAGDPGLGGVTVIDVDFPRGFLGMVVGAGCAMIGGMFTLGGYRQRLIDVEQTLREHAKLDAAAFDKIGVGIEKIGDDITDIKVNIAKLTGRLANSPPAP